MMEHMNRTRLTTLNAPIITDMFVKNGGETLFILFMFLTYSSSMYSLEDIKIQIAKVPPFKKLSQNFQASF
jgi:hypothetical protein